MTVRQLILELEQEDQDAVICSYDPHMDEYVKVIEIEVCKGLQYRDDETGKMETDNVIVI